MRGQSREDPLQPLVRILADGCQRFDRRPGSVYSEGVSSRTKGNVELVYLSLIMRLVFEEVLR